MAKIRQSNIDASVITGNTTLNETASLTDLILVYDQSSGTLKQISRKNLMGFPTVTSVSPTSVTSGDGTGNYTFTITGVGFTGGSASLINTSGTTINFDTVTVDSNTQITGVIAKSSVPGSGEPYDVKVTNSIGLFTTLEDQINIDQSPTFVTASGSLGSQVVGVAASYSVNATDPESAGNVTFELQSGSLPPGYSITNTAAEGGTAIISGTDNVTSGSTATFNFVLRAVDAASNTSSRSFSISSRIPASESFTSSGTFSVPSGITQADVLVVAGGGGAGSGGENTTSGGGGGAGGLIFMPAYPLTAGGTITVTVGCGGAGNSGGAGVHGSPGSPGADSAFGSPSDPGLTPTGEVLTAKGGGGGKAFNGCVPSGLPGLGGQGGSGGGGSYPGYTGGCATQPTQPGNSGAYGFGNPGGTGQAYAPSAPQNSGGGGGSGAAGGPVQGGIGKAYTISDGTTPVYYAGGGGGGPGGSGGQGGGANGPGTGQANKGGGGGGGFQSSQPGGAGGKGIVIVRY
jgi:fibronectin-binding autotransporter adhesin